LTYDFTLTPLIKLTVNIKLNYFLKEQDQIETEKKNLRQKNLRTKLILLNKYKDKNVI